MSKNILVTGASGNLGRATVEKLLSEGHKLIVTVSPGKTLGFHEDHPQVEIHSVDLMDEPGVEGLVNSICNSHGSIDAALLLVGGYTGGNIMDTPGSTLKKMYSLNFETAYFMARPVFKRMMAQPKGGRIVFIGSRPAIKTSDGKNSLAYALAKSLIFRLSDILNDEGSDRNVVSSVIVPSTLDTPANRQSMPKADFDAWVRPEAVAELMAYMISDKASALRDPVLKIYGKS
jgi:NAD(P)-dependent dehydrogenase (short-subunit alcohol dehydrogenase family)